MPRPRPRHEKPAASGTRASRRHVRECARLHDALHRRFAELKAKAEEARKWTYRGAYGIISYFKPGDPVPPGYVKVKYDEDGREIVDPAQEKAPGLAAEGFSSFFQEKETLSG